ncbi:hypothetical protein Bbelb_324790 [Branchiostoma belcheri]|nr:hypothetical protein Bbelb_324790 [Branchiostoma belcheri]
MAIGYTMATDLNWVKGTRLRDALRQRNALDSVPGSLNSVAIWIHRKMSFLLTPTVKTTFNTEARTISTTYAPQPWDFDHTGSVPVWRLLDQLAPKWLDTLTHWFTPPKDGPPFADMFFFRSTVEPFDPSLSEPADSFVYTVNVAPSDTDLFGHVGHFQFVRYCFDCLSIGREHSAYPALSQYKTEKVEVLFQGEARTGDVLTVVSWEDPEQSGTIKFQIKKGEDNVAQCSLQFFSTCSKM